MTLPIYYIEGYHALNHIFSNLGRLIKQHHTSHSLHHQIIQNPFVILNVDSSFIPPIIFCIICSTHFLNNTYLDFFYKNKKPCHYRKTSIRTWINYVLPPYFAFCSHKKPY